MLRPPVLCYAKTMKPPEILWTLAQAQAKAQLLANENQITYVVVDWASNTYKVLSEDWASRLSYESISVHKPAAG